jgi:magnesium transporter
MVENIERMVAAINESAKSIACNSKSNKVNQLLRRLEHFFPADISDILESVDSDCLFPLFKLLESSLKADVFMEFSAPRRKNVFTLCNPEEREILLDCLTIDELVDFFDELPDEDTQKYIKVLNKNERQKILSLLEFSETSAAGIMDSEVIVLNDSMTISKAVSLLQRIDYDHDKSLYRTIYVINSKRQLIGSILIEDLILNAASKKITSILKYDLLSIKADVDQDEIVSYMRRYNLEILPVVNEEGIFLGAITGKKLTKAMGEETSEDIFRMASMKPIEEDYFEISTSTMIFQRGWVLAVLMLLQSVSTLIINHYESILVGFLLAYVGMLTSTGGNSGSQVSALVIEGLASGSLRLSQALRFVVREIFMSTVLGILLGLIAFLRIYLLGGSLFEGYIVSITIVFIVIVSAVLGAVTPLFLKRLGMDPAYSAGPLLATIMDIIGIMLFTSVAYFGTKLFL